MKNKENIKKINNMFVIDKHMYRGVEKVSIYKVYPNIANCMTGGEVFTSFKPSKKELLEISKNEGWYSSEEDFEKFYKNIIVEKISFYSKR